MWIHFSLSSLNSSAVERPGLCIFLAWPSHLGPFFLSVLRRLKHIYIFIYFFFNPTHIFCTAAGGQVFSLEVIYFFGSWVGFVCFTFGNLWPKYNGWDVSPFSFWLNSFGSICMYALAWFPPFLLSFTFVFFWYYFFGGKKRKSCFGLSFFGWPCGWMVRVWSEGGDNSSTEYCFVPSCYIYKAIIYTESTW